MIKKNSSAGGSQTPRQLARFKIFEGSPLKPDMWAASLMILVSVFITACISLSFSFLYDKRYHLVLWTLFPGALLGFFLLVLERSLGRLKNYMFPQMGNALTAFLLFFIHVIGYLALSSLILNYPLGFFLAKTENMGDMAGKYSLFSVNFFIVLALFSWLRNVRSSPNRCF